MSLKNINFKIKQQMKILKSSHVNLLLNARCLHFKKTPGTTGAPYTSTYRMFALFLKNPETTGAPYTGKNWRDFFFISEKHWNAKGHKSVQ